MKSHRSTLQTIYRQLSRTFGPQDWWPGDSAFEIIIGAILTQNTNWQNVEKAISNLKRERCLTPRGLKKIPLKKLARLIRPAGYYNLKSKRLKNFIKFLFSEYQGRLDLLFRQPLSELRHQLLQVNGIGPETADSILLYAGGKPIFVVDAYTRRLLSRHQLLGAQASYNEIQELFMHNLPKKTKLFNEYHALIVKLGKEYCRKKPLCNSCPLNTVGFKPKEVKYGTNNC